MPQSVYDGSTPPTSIGGAIHETKAVIIHCVGDRLFLWKDKYTETMVPDSHDIFKKAKPTDISMRMKLPILIQKTNEIEPIWKHKKPRKHYKSDKDVMSNEKARILNARFNPKFRDAFGTTDPKKWDGEIGNVLVVRQDKKDITANQVRALAAFCSFGLLPLLRVYKTYNVLIEGLNNQKKRDEWAEAFISQDYFEKFFNDLKAGSGLDEQLIAAWGKGFRKYLKMKVTERGPSNGSSIWADEISPYYKAGSSPYSRILAHRSNLRAGDKISIKSELDFMTELDFLSSEAESELEEESLSEVDGKIEMEPQSEVKVQSEVNHFDAFEAQDEAEFVNESRLQNQLEYEEQSEFEGGNLEPEDELEFVYEV